MKNIQLHFIVTFVVAGVSAYYFDNNQKDLYEVPVENSNDWEDDNTDDYSRGMRNYGNKRYLNSYEEVSTDTRTDSNEFKEDYMSRREMRNDEVKTVYDHGDSDQEDWRTEQAAGGFDMEEDSEDFRSQSPNAQTTWINSIESLENSENWNRDSNHEDPTAKIVGGSMFVNGINGGCSNIRFRCQRDSTCLHVMFVCDGVSDCSDGEDEWPSSCQKNTGSVTVKPTSQPIRSSGCSSSEFLCKKDGKCVPLSYRCNKYFDCSDGEDEKFCTSILDSLPYRPGAMKTTTTTRPTSRKCRTYENRCSQHCLQYY